MRTDRRSLLKGLAAAATAAVAAPADLLASGGEPPAPLPGAVGMLYDTTLCIGCKSCVVACREANGMPVETAGYGNGLWDAPEALDERTKNIIQLWKDGDDFTYVKKQCMHCVDASCVGACMMSALTKDARGIVSWNGDSCVGCRYCQIACPYEVPKFEWDSAAPKIIKCELCRHRLDAGQEPACCEVCPRKAVIYGPRAELLQEAHRRLREHPEKYVPKVYGETDGGGTQVLYLSHVPFEEIGLPDLGPVSSAAVTRSVQGTVYKGFIAPLAVYGIVGLAIFRNRRAREAAAGDRNGQAGQEERS